MGTETNRMPIWVGKTKQFQDFFAKPGVMDALDIVSVKGTHVTFRTHTMKKDGKETPTCWPHPIFGCGTQQLKLSEDPDVDQVLYRRRGRTRFWCFKTEDQFKREGYTMG